MALTDTHSTTHTISAASIGTVLVAPFKAIGRFFVQIMESNSRLHQVEQLNALTDEELAKRGLRREDIVRFVFRDYMHF